jgi:hypothetical protein
MFQWDESFRVQRVVQPAHVKALWLAMAVSGAFGTALGVLFTVGGCVVHSRWYSASDFLVAIALGGVLAIATLARALFPRQNRIDGDTVTIDYGARFPSRSIFWHARVEHARSDVYHVTFLSSDYCPGAIAGIRKRDLPGLRAELGTRLLDSK